jgi:hypothetical protein
VAVPAEFFNKTLAPDVVIKRAPGGKRDMEDIVNGRPRISNLVIKSDARFGRNRKCWLCLQAAARPPGLTTSWIGKDWREHERIRV